MYSKTGTAIGLSGAKTAYGAGVKIGNYLEDAVHRSDVATLGRPRSVMDMGSQPDWATTTHTLHVPLPPDVYAAERAENRDLALNIKTKGRGQPAETIFHHGETHDPRSNTFFATLNDVAFSLDEPRRVESCLWAATKLHNEAVPTRKEHRTLRRPDPLDQLDPYVSMTKAAFMAPSERPPTANATHIRTKSTLLSVSAAQAQQYLRTGRHRA